MIKPIQSIQEWVGLLQKQGDCAQVDVPVDPHLELPEIHRRVISAGGPALLFTKVKDSAFPVASNLFGTARRVEGAVCQGRDIVSDVVQFMDAMLSPSILKIWSERRVVRRLLNTGLSKRSCKHAPVMENRLPVVDLEKIPFTTSWQGDGGPFLTLSLVYTEDPDGGGHNLGLYRMQRHLKDQTGMHWQIDKGGGFHYQVAEKQNKALPVSVFLGGPPVSVISAIAPLPENLGELLLASLLMGKKFSVSRFESWCVMPEAECVLLGEVPPHVRKPEGPFGDHYGYYSLTHDFPVFNVSHMFHRKNAIIPVTVVGKPRQEDFFIGDLLQELLSPLFPKVMPGVTALWSYGETGYHSLAGAIVKERYGREAMKHAFRILGEGQLSLTKFLILLTEDVDLKNFGKVLEHVLERFCPQTDLFIFANLSMDTLDYSGPELNRGSKGVLLASGQPVRTLLASYTGTLPMSIAKAAVFCPGCLVLSPETRALSNREKLESLCRHPDFKSWPLIILCDDALETARTDEKFLWTVFTRFDPAAHIVSGASCIQDNHVVHKGPVLIDARLKEGFPDELFVDERTQALVTKRWKEYFPEGNIEMGEPW